MVRIFILSILLSGCSFNLSKDMIITYASQIDYRANTKGEVKQKWSSYTSTFNSGTWSRLTFSYRF